jgi:hypothetical protein
MMNFILKIVLVLFAVVFCRIVGFFIFAMLGARVWRCILHCLAKNGWNLIGFRCETQG